MACHAVERVVFGDTDEGFILQTGVPRGSLLVGLPVEHRGFRIAGELAPLFDQVAFEVEGSFSVKPLAS